jgi:hypothetical protein
MMNKISRRLLASAILGSACAAVLLVNAQQPKTNAPDKSKHEAMEHMNERGDKVMGFDHLKTTHHFLLRSDGGVIQVEANEGTDTESRDQIRGHLRHISKMFGEGNFTAPMLVHETNPPGTAVMKQLQDKISYEFEETEKGARILISTRDAEALNAIHDFLRFQIKEHVTGDPLTLAAN